jgi:glycosyl transferase family 1
VPLATNLRNTRAWRFFRAATLERSYQRRAAAYHQRLEDLGFTYSEGEVVRTIRQRCTAAGRRLGEVRTLLLMPDMAWHNVLASSLEKLGPVTWYRFEGDCRWWRGRPADRKWVQRRAGVNQEIRRIAREACATGGIDWVFCYVSGQILRDTVRYLREELGLPTVIMSLDDKQSWELGGWGSQDIGQKDLAGEFDLYWTSARECCNWVLAEGGRPIFMPEGCDPDQFRPMDVQKDLDLCFVGAAYGFRRYFIERIQRRLGRYGYSVACFGPGWRRGSSGVWGEELVRTLNRAWINLGHGGIGYSENLMNVKTRDFEAPSIGTAAYLTTFNPDLVPSFDIGNEICCYRWDNDLVEQVISLLSEKERLLEIARCGRERCVEEHTWGHRFARILEILGVLDAEVRVPFVRDTPAAVVAGTGTK